LQTYADRAELDAITLAHFPARDYFVAPAHERTNWALGLGLPLVILGPDVGTFAPRNRELLSAQQVAAPLHGGAAAEAFGAQLDGLRQAGVLAQRAAAGWGRQPINGFLSIADALESF